MCQSIHVANEMVALYVTLHECINPRISDADKSIYTFSHMYTRLTITEIVQ